MAARKNAAAALLETPLLVATLVAELRIHTARVQEDGQGDPRTAPLVNILNQGIYELEQGVASEPS